MSYFSTNPIDIELDLTQEDFIQTEIMECLVDAGDLKSESAKAFIYQTLVCSVIAFIMFISKSLARESLIFPLVFFALFLINFLYKYFYGIENELKNNLNHMIESNRNGNVFFTPESGMIRLYDDRAEYLTNENRRYFNYTSIAHIKQTKLLYIFVMKNSREKSMRGFMYMIIPKRCLTEEQIPLMNKLCEEITQRYNLSPWTDISIMD